MDHSEADTDTSGTPTEDLVPIEEAQDTVPEGRPPSGERDFTPWREEPLPRRSVSRLGHRRLVKSGRLRPGTPVRITPEVKLEPEPVPEPGDYTIEVTPILEGETMVGLAVMCGCGARHEVRFEYGDTE